MQRSSGIIIFVFFFWFPVVNFIFFLLPVAIARKHETYSSSSTLSCGDFHNIKCPFTLKGANNPHNCRTPLEELVCDENNRTTYSPLPSKYFHVVDISYEDKTIWIVDPGLQKHNCSSMPRYSLSSSSSDIGRNSVFRRLNLARVVFYAKCSTPVHSPYYLDTSPCINATSSNAYTYIANPYLEDLKDSCTFWMVSAIEVSDGVFDSAVLNHSYVDIHTKMSNGFKLVWGRNRIPKTLFSKLIALDYSFVALFFSMGLILLMAGKFVLGTPFMIVFIIYTLRRRTRAMDPVIEDYLHDYRHLMPIRYSYNDAKRMAKNFKDKLGQGGYGFVYKGVLSNNHSVAIKVMATTKGNGQEFINEVASIGRIHHVNVVRLLGFVAERSKRALIYEFMPNGSLEKYIFPQEGNLVNPLSWIKMYEIALGIARGMDYLHRGCDIQILHFDIKPHNILLDENFIPKISDFGLAKLYSADDSIVSMTAARGTMGYFAPELLYRNIGGVSYKSDVYSFGVMLLEMAGRRKNINAYAENSSQIYFPSWIYDQLNRGKDIKMENVADEKETELAKKMIIVGLWCIQMKPVDRPSMLKVIEMLEGDLGLLQMPPKPNVLPDEDGNAVSIE